MNRWNDREVEECLENGVLGNFYALTMIFLFFLSPFVGAGYLRCLCNCFHWRKIIMAKEKNPVVFLDVSIDGDPAERMTFEVDYVVCSSAR